MKNKNVYIPLLLITLSLLPFTNIVALNNGAINTEIQLNGVLRSSGLSVSNGYDGIQVMHWTAWWDYVFGREKAGEVYVYVYAYKLSETSSGHDWYLVVVQIKSIPSSGWSTSDITGTLKLDYYDLIEEINDYAPHEGDSDDGSLVCTLGALNHYQSVTSQRGVVQFGFTISDVTLYDISDKSANKISFDWSIRTGTPTATSAYSVYFGVVVKVDPYRVGSYYSILLKVNVDFYKNAYTWVLGSDHNYKIDLN